MAQVSVRRIRAEGREEGVLSARRRSILDVLADFQAAMGQERRPNVSQ